MNVFYKNFILSIVLYFVLVIFDYVENNTFNWTENMIQSLFFVVFFRLFVWLLDGKKNKKIKPDLLKIKGSRFLFLPPYAVCLIITFHQIVRKLGRNRYSLLNTQFCSCLTRVIGLTDRNSPIRFLVFY